MSFLGDIILLNLLFIITSIPVVTAGTSATALYAAIKKRIHGRESYVMRDYFSLWKSNFKNSFIIWIILLPCILLMLLFTSYIARHLFNLTALIIYFIAFVLLAFITAYIFPLQATFVNTPLRLIRNSLLTAFAHFPYTLLLIFAVSVPVCITLCFPAAFYYTCAYWLLLGFSVTAIISAAVTEKVFRHYIPEQKN